MIRLLSALILILTLGAPARADDATRWSSAALVHAGDAAEEAGEHLDATVAWERARLLDPADPAVAERLSTPAPQLPLSPWHWDAALWTGLGLVLAGCGALVVARRRTGLVVGVLGATLVTVSGVALDQAADARQVLLAAPDAPLRISPAKTAPVVAALDAGERVRLVGPAHAGYVEVARTDGARGWLDASTTVPLVPPGS